MWVVTENIAKILSGCQWHPAVALLGIPTDDWSKGGLPKVRSLFFQRPLHRTHWGVTSTHAERLWFYLPFLPCSLLYPRRYVYYLSQLPGIRLECGCF